MGVDLFVPGYLGKYLGTSCISGLASARGQIRPGNRQPLRFCTLGTSGASRVHVLLVLFENWRSAFSPPVLSA